MTPFTGKQYLQIDIANSYGLDKESWDSRLEWFKNHEADILKDTNTYTKQAEEPAQFMAGVIAYKKFLEGKPSGYMCGLDATASGIQLLSVLSGCEQSASTCNLVSTGKREDAYTVMHQHMDKLLGGQNSFSRKVIKAAGMTHFYGSKAEPRAAFGEDTPQLRAFYQTIQELLPGADQLNQDLLSLWQPTALSHDWILPDGFDVRIKVMVRKEHDIEFLGNQYVVATYENQPTESGLSLGANIVHSIDGMVVREMGRRCNYNARKLSELYTQLNTLQGGRSTSRSQDLELLRLLDCAEFSGFFSLVIAEHIDEHNIGHLMPHHRQQLIRLIESLPKHSFRLIAIHQWWM